MNIIAISAVIALALATGAVTGNKLEAADKAKAAQYAFEERYTPATETRYDTKRICLTDTEAREFDAGTEVQVKIAAADTAIYEKSTVTHRAAAKEPAWDENNEQYQMARQKCQDHQGAVRDRCIKNAMRKQDQ